VPAVFLGDGDVYYGLGSFWSSRAEASSRDFRVIVHDHCGTGRSTHSRIEYNAAVGAFLAGHRHL